MTILCFELEQEDVRQREDSNMLSAMSQPQETAHWANVCCSTRQCCKIQKRMAVNACYFRALSLFPSTAVTRCKCGGLHLGGSQPES